MRVRHVFTAALVVVAGACGDPISDPAPIDSDLYISENPPQPDAGLDADVPKGATAETAPAAPTP